MLQLSSVTVLAKAEEVLTRGTSQEGGIILDGDYSIVVSISITIACITIAVNPRTVASSIVMMTAYSNEALPLKYWLLTRSWPLLPSQHYEAGSQG